MKDLPIHSPQDFKDFQTLYSMLKYKDLTGETIKGRYQIVGLLGAGGMGDVYRAMDLQKKETVALKRLMPPSNSKQRLQLGKRFLKEVACLEAIYSPYVVEIYDAFNQEETYYLIMEYIDGDTLDNIIQQTYRTQKRLTMLEHISIMTKITRGLEAIHATGVVHRDIKPANIMINRLKDIVKILDLGLACKLEHDEDALSLSGTIAYMSPEQISSADLSNGSDIFSVGSTFYYMLTGKAPFSGEGIQCMIEICEKTPEAPYKINPEVPKGLSALVMKTLEKDVQKRFANASELAQALDELRQRFLTHISEILTPQQHALVLSKTKRLSPQELFFLQQIAEVANDADGVKINAVIRLGRLRDRRALKPLILLLAEAHNHRQIALVQELIIALGKIGDLNGVEPIKDVLHSTADHKIRKLCRKVLNRLLADNPNFFWQGGEKYWDALLLKLEEKSKKLRLRWQVIAVDFHEWLQQKFSGSKSARQ